MSIKAYKHFIDSQYENSTYIITGVDVNGKRFKITTKTPHHYNIYKGSLWLLTEDNKRKLLKRYFN